MVPYFLRRQTGAFFLHHPHRRHHRRHGRLDDEADERAGRRESTVKDDVPTGHKYAEERLKAEIVQEALKKW